MREMKDSGVEWIGEIPKDWDCCKQKYRFTLINGRAFKDNEFEEDGTYRILRVGNLFSNPVWYSSSLELEPDKYCEKGDLIYAWSMSYGPYIWNEEKVIYHYHIWKTKLVSDMDKMFSYYYLQALTESIKSETHETTMGFVTMGIMNNSYIAYPRSIKEQKKISDYLDTKCTKIDEIIEKQQVIIEKLKEYKLSVIIEAVTKGLNSNVEMKDSGVEWIGLMPTSWDCTTVGRIATVVRGASPRPAGDPLYFNGNDVPWITVAEVTKGHGKYIDVTETFLTFEGAKQSRIVEEGTLLLSNSGATLGVPKITRIRGCINDGSVAFYNLSINQEFLLYLFKGRTFELRKQMQGYGQPNLNTTIVKEIEVPLPTELEQKSIVDFLDQKCSVIEKTIEDREMVIEKLQEYKKSLIYEVVTGKKEV